jgi:hypothetical protein
VYEALNNLEEAACSQLCGGAVGDVHAAAQTNKNRATQFKKK